MAQQAVIDHCKQTSTDADRIACLEAALLGKSPELRSKSPVDPPTVDKQVDAASVGEVPEGIGANQVIARNETREEQLAKLEKASGLTVTRYETVPYRKLQITLENGQIWRQIKGDTQDIRVDLKRNQTVDIEESSLSGYKLHLNEMQRTIRVERVQ